MFRNTAISVVRLSENGCLRNILMHLRTSTRVQRMQVSVRESSLVPFHHCDSGTRSNELAWSLVLAESKFHLTSLSSVARICSSSNDIVAFINSQGDLDKFFSQLVSLLQSGKGTKFWVPQSKETLSVLCHHLLDKGCDCMNIYSFFQANPNVLRTDQESLNYVIQYLHDLGLRGNQLLYILDKRPSLWRLRAEFLQERVQQLWNLGLTDGQMMKAILSFPEILSIKKKRFQSVLELLRKMQFTSDNIRQVISDSPQIFEEDEYQTELKLQYVFFMMGVTNYKEIIKAKIFNYSHKHIRLRHLVLERLGLYQVPDKHGRTKIRNPSLARIIDSTDRRFSSSCAGISIEDFNAFSEMLKEEIAEKEEEEDWSSGDEGDEEEEESELDKEPEGDDDDEDGQDEAR